MDNVTVRSKGTYTTYGVYAMGSFTIPSSDIEALSDGAKTRALYIGAGNNFDASGVKDVNGKSMSEFVITTEDVYKYRKASA